MTPPPSCKSLPFTIELSLFHAAVICFIYGLNNFILSWALKLKWMDGRDLSFYAHLRQLILLEHPT